MEATAEAGSLRGWVELFQDVVAAEQKSLGQHVDRLLSWLSETEAQMDTAGKDGLTQQLDLCKVISYKHAVNGDKLSPLTKNPK